MTAVDIVCVQLYEPETVWKNNYLCLCFKYTQVFGSMRNEDTLSAPLILGTRSSDHVSDYLLNWLRIGMLIRHSTNTLHCCPNFRMTYDLLN